MTDKFDISRRPNVIPWPPIIFGLCLVSGGLLSSYLPLRGYFSPLIHLFNGPGILLIGVSLFIDVWALVTLFLKNTNTRPHRGADRLVTTGPFAYSRNPIYLSNTITIFAMGLAFSHPWFFPMGLIHSIIIYMLAIQREEAHLKAKFGAAWDRYKKRVPRWFWRI